MTNTEPTFEHENDEPQFLLENAKEIARDVRLWKAGKMTAAQFEDAWGYDDPARAFRALIEAVAGPAPAQWVL